MRSDLQNLVHVSRVAERPPEQRIGEGGHIHLLPDQLHGEPLVPARADEDRPLQHAVVEHDFVVEVRSMFPAHVQVVPLPHPGHEDRRAEDA